MRLIPLKRVPPNLPWRRHVDKRLDDGFDLKAGLQRHHNLAGGSGQPTPLPLSDQGHFLNQPGSREAPILLPRPEPKCALSVGQNTVTIIANSH